MSEKGLQRPRQVTVSGGIGLAGALVLLIGLFDTMARTRSVDTRASVAEFLSKPPGDGLGVTVNELLELWRVSLFVAGALAAAAFVLGIFVFQRNNGARIGFTVASGLLLLTMPAVGILPVVLGVAAAGLWSQPARDWFAGRAPQPAKNPVQVPLRPQPLTSQDAPPPSPYPFGSPPPSGQQPPVQQQPPAPQPLRPYAAPPQPQQQWQPPPPPPGQWQAYPPPMPPVDPNRRPGTVLTAALLTWVGCGLTALMLLAAGALISANRADFETELEKQIQEDSNLRDLGVTADQMVGYIWGGIAVLVIWCLAASLIAFFAFRGAGWARILLVISAAGAALLSLLGILGIIPILTLVPSVVTVILLFTPSANAWYSRRTGPPAAYPPQGGYSNSGPW